MLNSSNLRVFLVRRSQLILTLLITLYVLFNASALGRSVGYRAQLFNTLAIFGLGALWLVLRTTQRGKMRSTGLELALAVFVLSYWITALTSQQVRLSIEVATRVTLWAVAFLVFVDVLAAGWPTQLAVDALIITAIVVTVQGLWEVSVWFANWLVLGLGPPVTYRVRGLAGSHFTAALVNLLLPLVIVLLLRTKTRAKRLGFFLLAIGLLIVLFFSSARGGWIVCLIGVGALAMLLWSGSHRQGQARWQKLRSFWQDRALPVRVLGVVAALALTATGAWLLALQAQHVTHIPLLDSRQGIWRVAWAQFEQHPVFGMGPGLFPWYWPREYSVPRTWLPADAHSLVFQVLGGSGLVGLAALSFLAFAAANGLGRIWRSADDRPLVASLIAGLISIAIYSLFIHLFGNDARTFFTLAVAALAFSRSTLATPKYPPILMALPILLAAGVSFYSLRAIALNDQALMLAVEDDWEAAGEMFERAAQADPGLTLYWAEAAQAYARAGQPERALTLLKRALSDDPHWAVLPANIGVLERDVEALHSALALAPESDLYWLNTGALYESLGQAMPAREAFRQTLDLEPASAGSLFWQQTPLRAELLNEWRNRQPVESAPLELGWNAFARADFPRALAHFEQARLAEPWSGRVYLGLAQTAWQLGNQPLAWQYLEVARQLYIPTPEYHRLQGDWLMARGKRFEAMVEYQMAFDSIYKYMIAGPGPNSYRDRYVFVYRRESLPSDLAPQFVRADLSPELDDRFTQLARWFAEVGYPENGCELLVQVRHDAPISKSAGLWETMCQ